MSFAIFFVRKTVITGLSRCTSRGIPSSFMLKVSLPFTSFALNNRQHIKVSKFVSQWRCVYCSIEKSEHHMTSEIASSQAIDLVRYFFHQLVGCCDHRNFLKIANELASFSSKEVNDCSGRTSTLCKRKCKTTQQVKEKIA